MLLCPFHRVIILLIALLLPAGAAAGQDVDELLVGVGDAYANLPGLRLEATVTADYAVAGMEQRHALQYTAAIAADGRFRHEAAGQLIVAGDADASYVYVPAGRRYYRSDRGGRAELDPAARRALEDHNLSLLLALSPDAAEALRSLGELSLGQEPGQLQIQREDHSSWRLWFDRQTHLLRRIEVDESELLKAAGATGVERALRVIDYTLVEPDEAPEEALLAFKPPADAQEVERAGPAVGAGTLAGKPAPDFTLPNLDGGQVRLSELRGRVVLVDFWASWCGPCVQGLPHIASLAETRADEGLVVLAVNLREDEARIRQFFAAQNYNAESMRLLRDSDGAVARQWGVTGIPFTAVIGRDGVVREVIVGLAPDRVTRAVAAALDQ